MPLFEGSSASFTSFQQTKHLWLKHGQCLVPRLRYLSQLLLAYTCASALSKRCQLIIMFRLALRGSLCCGGTTLASGAQRYGKAFAPHHHLRKPLLSAHAGASCLAKSRFA